MIAWVAFVSLFLGLATALKAPAWLYAGVMGGWLVFVYWRFHKPAMILAILCYASGVGYGAIRISTPTQQTVFKGIVSQSKTNYYCLNTGLHTYYVGAQNHPREIGDILEVSGTLYPLVDHPLETRFDFVQYLAQKGISYRLYPTQEKVIFASPVRPRQAVDQFLSHFDDETADLVGSIVFGRRADDDDLSGTFERLQLTHLLIVSGLHINLLFAGLLYLVELIIPKRWAPPMVLGLMVPYLIYVGPHIGVIRATLMFIFRWINDIGASGRIDGLTQKSIIGVLCLLFSRYIVNNPGFILGFSLSMFLSFAQPAIRRFPRGKRKMVLSLLCALFVVPWIVSERFSLNVTAWFAQCLLSPLILLLFFLGIIRLYIGFPTAVITAVSHLLKQGISWADSWRYEVILGTISWGWVLVFFMGLSAVTYCLEIKAGRWAGKVALLGSLLLSMQAFPVRNYLTQEVTFVNVGQGDCILLRDGFHTVMIDTGGSLYFDIAEEILMPYLKKRKIDHLDALIITHDDHDHNGGAATLNAQFPIQNYVTDAGRFPLTFGGLSLESLNPLSDPGLDDNESSLVLRLNFLGKKWLFMGDAPIAIENAMMAQYADLDIDMLKVGHHGSMTSTSLAFLRATTPEEAIISVGENSYGHPSTQVLERLSEAGVAIRRTDLEGTISYTSWRF